MAPERPLERCEIPSCPELLQALMVPSRSQLRLEPRVDPMTQKVVEYVTELRIMMDEGAVIDPMDGSRDWGLSLEFMLFAVICTRAARLVQLANFKGISPTVVVRMPARVLRASCRSIWLAGLCAGLRIDPDSLKMEVAAGEHALDVAGHSSSSPTPPTGTSVRCIADAHADTSSGVFHRWAEGLLEPASVRRHAMQKAQTQGLGAPALGSKLTGVEDVSLLDHAISLNASLTHGALFALDAGVAACLREINTFGEGGG